MKYHTITLLFLGSIGLSTAQGTVFDVPPEDSGAFKEAIAQAGSNDEPDVIELAPGSEYSLDGRVDPIEGRLVINGRGAILQYSGNSIATIEISPDSTLTLRDIHAQEFSSTVRSAFIRNEGELRLERVTINNTEPGTCGHFGGCRGSVILNLGSLILESTSLAMSAGPIAADGVVMNEGEATLRNVTIASNFNVGLNNEGTATVVNSIIAGNKNGDCMGNPITSLGHNLDSDGSCGFDQPTDLPDTNPRLGDFGDHGGLVPTVALRPESPAIDAGNPATCSLVDGRGFVRASGPNWDCDIGAFEADGKSSDIKPALTATWFDVREDGHFFNVQVLDGDRNEVLVHWNTFDTDGNPLWLQGLAEIQGHRVDMTLYEYGGMAYPEFDPSERTHEPWGTLTMAFPNCWRGVALYEPLDPVLSAAESRLIRLTHSAGLSCR